MSRFKIVAGCLVLGFSSLWTMKVQAQTESMVEQIDRLLQNLKNDRDKKDLDSRRKEQIESLIQKKELDKIREVEEARKKADQAAADADKRKVEALNARLYAFQKQKLDQATADPLLNLGEKIGREYYIPLHREPANGLLGATMTPVEEWVRAHLNLPAGQGLVVSTLSENGACAQAGLKNLDILLTLADKPVGKVEDFIKALKEMGDKPGKLTFLREGKPMEIQVRSIHHVSMGLAEKETSSYFIGVTIESVDEVLQKALQLSDGKGVMITEVIENSPAEKAGLKKYDLITAMDGKTVENPEQLRATVQSAKTKPVKIDYLRGGKTQSITVTPIPRKQEVGKAENLQKDQLRYQWVVPLINNANQVNPDQTATYLNALRNNVIQWETVKSDPNAQIAAARLQAREEALVQSLAKMEADQKAAQARAENLEAQIRALRAAIDALTEKNKELKKEKK